MGPKVSSSTGARVSTWGLSRLVLYSTEFCLLRDILHTPSETTGSDKKNIEQRNTTSHRPFFVCGPRVGARGLEPFRGHPGKRDLLEASEWPTLFSRAVEDGHPFLRPLKSREAPKGPQNLRTPEPGSAPCVPPLGPQLIFVLMMKFKRDGKRGTGNVLSLFGICRRLS